MPSWSSFFIPLPNIASYTEVFFIFYFSALDTRLKMTAQNIPEEELPCDVEMEGFMGEGPHFSILGDSWDCRNWEGDLCNSALTQEKSGAREAICEYPGLGGPLSASSDLSPSRRVPATNGFHIYDSEVFSLLGTFVLYIMGLWRLILEAERRGDLAGDAFLCGHGDGRAAFSTPAPF